jgi:hypothetical protein
LRRRRGAILGNRCGEVRVGAREGAGVASRGQLAKLGTPGKRCVACGLRESQRGDRQGGS